jgi:hypothetical protein
MHVPRKKWQGVAVFRAYKCPCVSVTKWRAFHEFRNYKEMAASFEYVVNKFQETANIPPTSLGLVCWSKVGNKQSYFSGTSFKVKTRHWHLYKSGLPRSKMT